MRKSLAIIFAILIAKYCSVAPAPEPTLVHLPFEYTPESITLTPTPIDYNQISSDYYISPSSPAIILDKNNFAISFISSNEYISHQNEGHIPLENRNRRQELIDDIKSQLCNDGQITFYNKNNGMGVCDCEVSNDITMTCNHEIFGTTAGDNIADYFTIHSHGIFFPLFADYNTHQINNNLLHYTSSFIPITIYFKPNNYLSIFDGICIKFKETPSEDCNGNYKFTLTVPIKNGNREKLIKFEAEVEFGQEYNCIPNRSGSISVI